MWIRIALLLLLLPPSAPIAAFQSRDREPRPSYRLPYENGKSFPLTQGNNGSTSHKGSAQYAFDFGLPEGTKICAARDGKIVSALDGADKDGPDGKNGENGNHVRIDHGDGTQGVYCHLQKDGVLVKEGDFVLQGDIIGLSGNTGRSTGPHLHFQVNRGGKSIPIVFDDVEEDGGVPQKGKSYTSRNIPGVPAKTKELLTTLQRIAKTAAEEGAFHIAHKALTRLANEKLTVPYPPQEEARARIEEIGKAAQRLAEAAREKQEEGFEEAARDLLLARLPYSGTSGETFVEKALQELEKDDRLETERRTLQPLLKQQEQYFRGLQMELEGKLVQARTCYKNILQGRTETEFSKKAAARAAKIEEILKSPPKGS